MNPRIFTGVLAVALIGSFFLPYVSLFGISEASGFDFVTESGGMGGDTESIIMKYLFLLIPVSGIMLLIGALNNGHYFLGRTLWALLPLLTIVYFIVRVAMESSGVERNQLEMLFHMIGVGLWITLIASIILAVYHPKGR